MNPKLVHKHVMMIPSPFLENRNKLKDAQDFQKLLPYVNQNESLKIII